MPVPSPALDIPVITIIKRPFRSTGKNNTKQGLGFITVTLVFASNVHEVEAFMTFADVTPKSVDTLPVSRAGGSSSSTFINV